MLSQPFYGLDFGTSNSVIAIAKDGESMVLPIDPVAVAKEVFQSLLYFKKGGTEYAGQSAIEEYIQDNAKRKPVSWEEIDTGEMKEVEVVGDNGIIYYKTTIKIREDINKPGQFVHALKTTLREGSLQTAHIFHRQYDLEDLIAKILQPMKEAADQFIGQEIKNVVLGRPVHYIEAGQDDVHVEERMKEAAYRAGFEQVTFLAEPIAAALSYLARIKKTTTVLIFDFGGGTLDFSLVGREPNKRPRVINTSGLPIGGNTFNEEIMIKLLAHYFGMDELWGPKQLPVPAYLRQSLRKWYELDHLQTPEIKSFLREVERSIENSQYIINFQELINYDLGYHLFRQIEEAKKELSVGDRTRITFIRERLQLDVEITRSQFEAILAPYLIQIDRALDSVVEEAGLSFEKIDHVVATGGSSLIPAVQDMLHSKFGKEKVVYHDIFTGVGAGLVLADSLEN